MGEERENQRSPETVRKIGRIIAVCLSDDKAYPKFPQEKVVIGPFGIVGDAHSGEFRQSYRDRNKLTANDRAISIVADEVRQELSQVLGVEIQPGWFNENILVSGVGDLSDLQSGDLFRFSSQVVLRVTGQNTPCEKLESFLGREGIIKALVQKQKRRILNKRGVIADVVQQGELSPSESFEISKVNS